MPCTLDNVLAAKYQAAIATEFDTYFIGREMMIRAIGEIYLRAFHVSTVGELVGPNLSLIEPTYAEEYLTRRGTKDELRPLVESLRRMQDFCDARHIASTVLITPSKATIYPENLPANWLRRYKPTPRYYHHFVRLLQERGIRYVDGHRLAADMKPTARAPVFPLGGIHWGDPLALATANALLETLSRQRLGVQPIRNFTTRVSDVPRGQDRDLADLVNTALPWRYPVETVAVEAGSPPEGYRPDLVVVGGSFLWKILDLLGASRQFSEMECYFYYTANKTSQIDDERHQIAKPAPPLNFNTDVFAADALVLEANEQTLPALAEHLTRFLKDALANLPDPQTPKAPFHYEGHMAYRWGDTLSFVANRQPLMNIGATRGFATFTESGSRTVGPVASLHFTASPPDEDMVLEMTAGALIADTRLPEQRASVYANGHAVGEWAWRSPVAARHELLIPKEFLSGGEVWLEFRIAHPMSMSELGFGKDSRKIGLEVSSVCLHAARN